MSQMMMQAAVSMGQLQNKLDLIGGNLSNGQTTGYKGRQSEFSSLLFREINNLTDPKNAEGRVTPDGIRIGTGAGLGAVNIDLRPGTIEKTERNLDTALTKENTMYQIQTSDDGQEEVRYSRDGAFYLSPINDDEMSLVNSDGDPILGVDGPIVLQNGFQDLTINEQGEIVVNRNGQNETAGQLAIVEAVRPRMLEAAGDNMFRVPNNVEAPLEDLLRPLDVNEVAIEESSLEQSNVDVSEQMTELTNAQRSYQFNSRTISMADQMDGLINQLR